MAGAWFDNPDNIIIDPFVECKNFILIKPNKIIYNTASTMVDNESMDHIIDKLVGYESIGKLEIYNYITNT